MPVQHIRSEDDWRKALSGTKGFGGKALIIDFTASWCGPCQKVAPIYEQLSAQFPNVTFYKCDVDECQEVASGCGVRAMPTFVGFFNGEKVDEVVGADMGKLKDMIQTLSNKAGSGAGAAGQKLGGSAAGGPAEDETPEARRARMLAALEARGKA